MDSSIKRKVVAGTVAALAVGGTGAGIAATQLGGSPSAESKAVVNDAAKQLGVQPAQLTDAIKKALSARVDAAVAAGRLTKEQGAEMKARIASDNFPLFGPQAFDGGHFGHRGGPGLDAAATYLGLSEDKLHAQLESGKTLAQVATAPEQVRRRADLGTQGRRQAEARRRGQGRPALIGAGDQDPGRSGPADHGLRQRQAHAARRSPVRRPPGS